MFSPVKDGPGLVEATAPWPEPGAPAASGISGLRAEKNTFTSWAV